MAFLDLRNRQQGGLFSGLLNGILGNPAPYAGPGDPQALPGQAYGAPQAAAPMQAAPQTVDMSARSATPAPTAPLMAPQAQEPGLSDRLSAFVHNGQGEQGLLAKLFDSFNGLSTGVRTDPQGVALQQRAATYQALRDSGVSDAAARAAVLNPEILKTIAGAAFDTKPQFTQVGEDMFGNKQFGFVQPGRMQVTPVGQAGGMGGALGASGPGSPGVDENKTGEDYLAQFPKIVQSAVRSYVNGESMPTGNPRKGFVQSIKMIAQKYGQDIGLPADDTTFAARREMKTGLNRATPGSLGGQITFAGTSLGHLAEVAEKAANLDNWGGMGFSLLARGENAARGMSTSQAAKVNDVNSAVQHYGQEITKFYTGSPGGEAERMRFLNTMDSTKSPQEIAGAIRAERDLIPSRLEQLKGQIQQTLGPQAAASYMARANLDKVIPRINAALAKLDPSGPEAKMAGAESGGLPSGWAVRVK